MIKREQYLSKIRPFMNQNIVKVLTGIRRCGKSVMLELIKIELIELGFEKSQFLSINLESKMNPFEHSVDGIYDYVKLFVQNQNRKCYLFFDEIQESEELISSLKWYCEDERPFKIICAGSLLGVKLK